MVMLYCARTSLLPELIILTLLSLLLVLCCRVNYQNLKQEQSATQTSEKTDGGEIVKSRFQQDSVQVAHPNARVRHLKDQLIRAKVYLSLPGTRNNPHLTRELRLRIKEVQRTLGDASKDSELPKK